METWKCNYAYYDFSEKMSEKKSDDKEAEALEIKCEPDLEIKCEPDLEIECEPDLVFVQPEFSTEVET